MAGAEVTRVRLRVRVTGKVQGVGFRYFTVTVARELGVVGWVRNDPDGAVSCEVEGLPDQVSQFRRRVERGPPPARVAGCEEAELPPRGDEVEFGVRR